MFGVPVGRITRRGRQHNLLRDVALLVAREILAEPANSLAARFGVGKSAVSESIRRARLRAESDLDFREAVESLKQRILSVGPDE